MKLYPTIRYEDMHGARDWLQRVLGFEEAAFLESRDGTIKHAEMRWGKDILMFAPPSEALPAAPVVLYLTCDDPDAAFTRATDAGAEVVDPVADGRYGGREFVLRDPESNVFVVGSMELGQF